MSVRLSALSEDERRALDSIARALSYFARERIYGYIDKLANAFNVVTARHVITEALRDLKSERDRGNEKIWLPRAEDVEVVLKLCEKDLSVLKILASLALAYGW